MQSVTSAFGKAVLIVLLIFDVFAMFHPHTPTSETLQQAYMSFEQDLAVVHDAGVTPQALRTAGLL